MDREKGIDVIYFQNDLHRPLSFAFDYMQVHPLTGQVLYANQAERFEAQHHLVYGESERFSVASLGAACSYSHDQGASPF